MPKKRYVRANEAATFTDYGTALPTHLPVANYYRQSTMGQVGNQSTSIQTVDMVEYLKRLGWAEENIIMIDMDAGISGTKKIDERPGMSELFRLITQGKVGAVSCQDEDRLFRDVTQIQVNIFIEACREHRVCVITPSMIYHFHHKQMGTVHTRQFRFKSEMAAEYITAYIQGRLQQSKRRVLMDGRWAGPPMPPGYMADMRKTLPSGAPNPNWRKFAIFEPYAEVVRAYWRLFLEHGGQIRPTIHHIWEHGPYFPDPESCHPPEGFKVVYRIRQYRGKWCPAARTSLRLMLTNAMYAGHWMVNGNVVLWNNHPAIIDQDTFMRAFHYLSDTALDGSRNEHYAPVKVNARPSKEEERPEPWPLCAGLIYSQDTDGEWIRVGTRWSKTNGKYGYEHCSRHDDRISFWWRRAATVDQAITDALLQRIQATFDFDAWEGAVAELMQRVEEENALRESQLKQLQTVMDNLIASLSTLQHPQMIRSAEKQYEDAEAEFQRLQQEIASQQAHTVQMEQIRALRDSCGEIFANWPNMTRAAQREVVHGFVHRVEAVSREYLGLDMVIYWTDGGQTHAYIASRPGGYLLWTEKEKQRVIQLVESEADQIEIARAFPDRSWNSIMQQYYLLVPQAKRVKKRRRRLIQLNETYNEYVARTGGKRLANMTSEAHSEREPPGVPC